MKNKGKRAIFIRKNSWVVGYGQTGWAFGGPFVYIFKPDGSKRELTVTIMNLYFPE